MFRIALRDCVLRLRRYQLWAPFLLSCIVAILPPIEDILWVIVIGAIYMRLTAGFFKDEKQIREKYSSGWNDQRSRRPCGANWVFRRRRRSVSLKVKSIPSAVRLGSFGV